MIEPPEIAAGDVSYPDHSTAFTIDAMPFCTYKYAPQNVSRETLCTYNPALPQGQNLAGKNAPATRSTATAQLQPLVLPHSLHR